MNVSGQEAGLSVVCGLGITKTQIARGRWGCGWVGVQVCRETCLQNQRHVQSPGRTEGERDSIEVL